MSEQHRTPLPLAFALLLLLASAHKAARCKGWLHIVHHLSVLQLRDPPRQSHPSCPHPLLPTPPHLVPTQVHRAQGPLPHHPPPNGTGGSGRATGCLGLAQAGEGAYTAGGGAGEVRQGNGCEGGVACCLGLAQAGEGTYSCGGNAREMAVRETTAEGGGPCVWLRLGHCSGLMQAG